MAADAVVAEQFVSLIYLSHSIAPLFALEGWIQFSMLSPECRTLGFSLCFFDGFCFFVTLCMKMGWKGKEGVAQNSPESLWS